jgi:hypothetical protein
MAIKARTPATPRVSEKGEPKFSTHLKRLHRKYGQGKPLKQYVQTLESDVDKQAVDNWLFNKKANFSKPPLGIGSTRKKKGGKQGGGKQGGGKKTEPK